MLQMLWSFSVVGVTNFMFFWAMYKQYFPYHLQAHVEKYAHKIVGWVSPNVHITFHEYTGERLNRSGAYVAIRNYLSENATARAKRLKANESKNTKSVVLSIDEHEVIEDEFRGVKVKWSSNVKTRNSESQSGRSSSDERRYFTLTFHRSQRNLVTGSYIEHVLTEGKAIEVSHRERKLFTNNSTEDWFSWRDGKWSSVPFDHPATFDTLAMDPAKKDEIMKDLEKFSRGKEYYRKVGKPWKRGYLLHGPPGTGKSTMISAMANLLGYDVYDLELTTVKNNTELKKLLLDTTSKSIIVIEDIDCSLELTGQRRKKNDDDEEDEEEEKKEAEKKEKIERDKRQSKVTLSGLLNAIDGLWSACNGEKIIVFTTNFLDKLDPALIRRGRMDKHIEMSYCGYEAFKVLAKNYLEIESHELYDEIKRLLEETDMSPADVAENLMPKSDEEDENTCLKRLVLALEEAKEKAQEMAEEEKKKKAEREEKRRKKAEEEEEKKKKKAKEEEEEEEKKKAEEEDKTKKKNNKTFENGEASDQEKGKEI